MKSLAFMLLVAFSVQQAFPADFFDRKIEDAKNKASREKRDPQAEYIAKLDKEATSVPLSIQKKMDVRKWKNLYVDEGWENACSYGDPKESRGRPLEGKIVKFYEYRMDGNWRRTLGVGIEDKDGKVWRAWNTHLSSEDSKYVKAVLEEMPKPKPKPKAATKRKPR